MRRKKRNLHIFDFDDTLVKSDSKVIITHIDGSVDELTSSEYAKYVPRRGDEFNFENFEKYPDSIELIQHTYNNLIAAINKDGIRNVVILTARSNPAPVKKFLKTLNLGAIDVEAVGSSDPMLKALYVISRIKDDDITMVHVHEDNLSNIRAIRKVVDNMGNIKFQSTLIRH